MRAVDCALVAVGGLFGLGQASLAAAQASQPTEHGAPLNRPSTPGASSTKQQRVAECTAARDVRRLTGSGRFQFMSDCIAGRVLPTPPGGGLTGMPPSDADRLATIEACNVEAARQSFVGNQRQTFMETCLSR